MSRNNEENLLSHHLNIIKKLFLIGGVATYIINELMTNGIVQPDGTEITRQLFDLDPRCNDQPTILICWLMRCLEKFLCLQSCLLHIVRGPRAPTVHPPQD